MEEFSKEAEEAEHFGIEPNRLLSEVDGRRTEVEVYLGAVIISSFDKVVVPFFGKGLPLEYELTRSIRTVATDKRHKIGVLTTDANVLNFSQEWQIVTELKKQYDVEQVSPASPIDESSFDVLMVVMPSSLTSEEMDNLVTYVKAGHPALIFDDPFPIALGSGMGVTNAPRLQKPQPNQMGGMGGMFGGQQPPPPPKADGGKATRLLNALDIQWDYDRIAFDYNNPHPQYDQLPAEYVFVTRDGHPDAFSNESPVSSGLQEVLSIYTGFVKERNTTGRETQFVDLLKTSGNSGRLEWDDFTSQNFDFFSRQSTVVPKPEGDIRHDVDKFSYVLAARVTSDKEGDERNAIFVADVDMISDFFFRSRLSGDLDLTLDNVTFVLNAVDALIGDETYIPLRSRRAEHRTLSRLELQKKKWRWRFRLTLTPPCLHAQRRLQRW